VSRLIRTRKRYIFGAHIEKKLHKVEQNAAVMGITPPHDPQLWFTAKQKQKAQALIPEGGAVLGVGPTANWIGKTWPAERFIDVVSWLTEQGGLMAGAHVAVFAAPGEEEPAREVLASIPEGKRLDLIAKTDPGTAAAALSLCDFYIGNDSGLMHCAVASGTPTFGVFGPSKPEIYRPWGEHSAFSSTRESLDELIGYEGYNSKTCGCLMETLSVEMVKEQIQKSWPNMMASSSKSNLKTA
jgi:ADP-heptose:LPS heptosyltransferase